MLSLFITIVGAAAYFTPPISQYPASRDQLSRLEGVGDDTIFGGRNCAMRIWLDLDKVAGHLTAGEVVPALQAQPVCWG